MKWLLKGGRVVDPASGLNGPADVLVEGGRIAAVGQNLAVNDATSIEDVTGSIVCPGFIDMHVHLREPGREDKETIESGVRAAVRGGFVAVAAMPNTAPPMDSVGTVQFVQQRARDLRFARVYPVACVSKGQVGEEIAELATLHHAGAVAFSDDGKCLMNADLMRRALEYAKMLDVAIIGHEEDEHLSSGGAAHEGYHSVVLGIPGIPSAAEEVIVARDILLARYTGGRVHIAHISSARSVEMVRQARRQGVQITAEVTPHHLLLTDAALQDYDANYKMNPPLRTELDREALIEGLRDGTIDCIATDHAPHTREDKEVEFGCAAFGVIGMETAVPVLLDRLVATNRISLPRLVEAFSTAPARILRLDLGRIGVGQPACLTVLDLAAEETLSPDHFESKARNCPFGGWRVLGVPSLTVVDGRVVMRHRQVVSGEGSQPWAAAEPERVGARG